jgi:hypothetical protein
MSDATMPVNVKLAQRFVWLNQPPMAHAKTFGRQRTQA